MQGKFPNSQRPVAGRGPGPVGVLARQHAIAKQVHDQEEIAPIGATCRRFPRVTFMQRCPGSLGVASKVNGGPPEVGAEFTVAARVPVDGSPECQPETLGQIAIVSVHCLLTPKSLHRT